MKRSRSAAASFNAAMALCRPSVTYWLTCFTEVGNIFRKCPKNSATPSREFRHSTTSEGILEAGNGKEEQPGQGGRWKWPSRSSQGFRNAGPDHHWKTIIVSREILATRFSNFDMGLVWYYNIPQEWGVCNGRQLLHSIAQIPQQLILRWEHESAWPSFFATWE